MASRWICSVTVVLLIFSQRYSSVYADNTVSITEALNYTLQRICAQACFYNTLGFEASLVMAGSIGCGFNLPMNACFCCTDLEPLAVSYLTSCVSVGCSNTNDVQTATSIYLNYCTSNGYSTVAAPTSATAIPSQTIAPSTPSQTKSSSSGKSLYCVV